MEGANSKSHNVNNSSPVTDGSGPSGKDDDSVGRFVSTEGTAISVTKTPGKKVLKQPDNESGGPVTTQTAEQKRVVTNYETSLSSISAAGESINDQLSSLDQSELDEDNESLRVSSQQHELATTTLGTPGSFLLQDETEHVDDAQYAHSSPRPSDDEELDTQELQREHKIHSPQKKENSISAQTLIESLPTQVKTQFPDLEPTIKSVIEDLDTTIPKKSMTPVVHQGYKEDDGDIQITVRNGTVKKESTDSRGDSISIEAEGDESESSLDTPPGLLKRIFQKIMSALSNNVQWVVFAVFLVAFLVTISTMGAGAPIGSLLVAFALFSCTMGSGAYAGFSTLINKLEHAQQRMDAARQNDNNKKENDKKENDKDKDKDKDKEKPPVINVEGNAPQSGQLPSDSDKSNNTPTDQPSNNDQNLADQQRKSPLSHPSLEDKLLSSDRRSEAPSQLDKQMGHGGGQGTFNTTSEAVAKVLVDGATASSTNGVRSGSTNGVRSGTHENDQDELSELIDKFGRFMYDNILQFIDQARTQEFLDMNSKENGKLSDHVGEQIEAAAKKLVQQITSLKAVPYTSGDKQEQRMQGVQEAMQELLAIIKPKKEYLDKLNNQLYMEFAHALFSPYPDSSPLSVGEMRKRLANFQPQDMKKVEFFDLLMKIVQSLHAFSGDGDPDGDAKAPRQASSVSSTQSDESPVSTVSTVLSPDHAPGPPEVEDQKHTDNIEGDDLVSPDFNDNFDLVGSQASDPKARFKMATEHAEVKDQKNTDNIEGDDSVLTDFNANGHGLQASDPQTRFKMGNEHAKTWHHPAPSQPPVSNVGVSGVHNNQPNEVHRLGLTTIEEDENEGEDTLQLSISIEEQSVEQVDDIPSPGSTIQSPNDSLRGQLQDDDPTDNYERDLRVVELFKDDLELTESDISRPHPPPVYRVTRYAFLLELYTEVWRISRERESKVKNAETDRQLTKATFDKCVSIKLGKAVYEKAKALLLTKEIAPGYEKIMVGKVTADRIQEDLKGRGWMLKDQDRTPPYTNPDFDIRKPKNREDLLNSIFQSEEVAKVFEATEATEQEQERAKQDYHQFIKKLEESKRVFK